jgi:predicted  nucleic acid-binding Zn-ribbon protein
MKEQDLLQLKRKVETAKQNVSELRGQQTAVMKQLKDEYGCKTIEEAEEKVKTLNTKVTKINNRIDEGVVELKEKFEL